jgi:hypothetical protein
MTTSPTFLTSIRIERTTHATHAHLAPMSRPRAPLATLATLAMPIVTALAVLMVLVASLIGPFILFALPLMLAFGCALGPLHALARGELR